MAKSILKNGNFNQMIELVPWEHFQDLLGPVWLQQIRIIPFGAANYIPVHETLPNLTHWSSVREVQCFFAYFCWEGQRGK